MFVFLRRKNIALIVFQNSVKHIHFFFNLTNFTLAHINEFLVWPSRYKSFAQDLQHFLWKRLHIRYKILRCIRKFQIKTDF